MSALRLKRPSGWFAAGTEWQRALGLLSDGAFKLFVWVSLEAERSTGRLAFHQAELARTLGKSRRSLQTYLEELQEKQVCRILAARNQHTAGLLEICPDYWPYVAESLTSGPSHPEENYVEAIGQIFVARPCVRSLYAAADRQLARHWFHSGLALPLAEQAIFLGCARKYASWLNGLNGEPIGSLAYFIPVLEEISKFELSLEYQTFNRFQLHRLEKQWLALNRLPVSTSNPPIACAKVAQAKSSQKGETR